MIVLIISMLACYSSDAKIDNGWREITSPRPDLQCWVRWSNEGSVVCSPSLNSTHGASSGTN